MRLPTRRVVSSLPVILAIIALLLSALYVIGLVFDWPAWLRGSNWVWVRRVPSPGARFWLMPAALAGGLALGAAAVRGGAWSRRRTALFLGGLIVLAPLLQLAVAAQHRAQPLSLVVMSATGFWQEGARIEEPLRFAREHVARMPTYADVHVRTQPPGWPLAYWALSQGLARFPAAADWLGGHVRRYDCLSPEFVGLSAAQMAAGYLRVVILALSGLGAPLLYAVARRFSGAGAARLAAVGYGYLPALLVFSGRFDVAYALLALAAVWLALRAVLDGRRGSAVALAVLVGVGSFFTFTAAAIAALALLVAGTAAVAAFGRRDGRLWRVVGAGGAVAGVVLLFWGGLWLLGVDGLAMWRVGQAIHREYRLNYPVWFLFNLYDLAVFMGIVPFVGAVGALLGRRMTANDRRPTTGLHTLALGWGAVVLLLNLSATVRAETGRLWLFLMPVGMLVGLAWFAERLRGSSASPGVPSASEDADSAQEGPSPTLSPTLSQRAREAEALSPAPLLPRSPALLPALLFAAYLTQALVMGYLLGGRAGEPATPPPQWDVPAGAQAVTYQLGDTVALRGYRIDPAADGARLTLYWQALDFPRAEYSAFVHALDASGATIGQSDGPPAAVPMWCWIPGEVVADERRLSAATTPDGFAVGLYEPLSGQRLPVRPPTPDDRIVLPGAE
ncbi:MAG: hypothetical protein IPH95_11565 [Candidatus Promineofilum sp.]|nr:hypothetical protein [Promineifilum sp.]